MTLRPLAADLRYETDALAADDDDPQLEALCAGLRAPVEDVAELAAGDIPLGDLYDLQTAPDWALPSLARIGGQDLPARRAGETDTAYAARARALLGERRRRLRGTIEHLRRAVAESQPDTVDVTILRRSHPTIAGDQAAHLQVILGGTGADLETAERVARANTLWYLTPHVRIDNSERWDELDDDGTTWADLDTAGTTWQDLQEGIAP